MYPAVVFIFIVITNLYAADVVIEVGILDPPVSSSSQLGKQVAFDDGIIVVSAPYQDIGAQTAAGEVFLYSVSSSSSSTSFAGPFSISLPVPSSNDNFGTAIALYNRTLGVFLPETLSFIDIFSHLNISPEIAIFFD
jgi:hypothetical protein